MTDDVLNDLEELGDNAKEYIKSLEYYRLEIPKCPYCDHTLEKEQYENIPYDAEDVIFCENCGETISITNMPISLYTTRAR